MAHKTFASIRFTGDRLEPALLTDIMLVRPTLSYHKGETFKVGKSERTRTGRTGLWLLSSENTINSGKLLPHIRYLNQIIVGTDGPGITPAKSEKIHRFVLSNQLDFVMTLFWHGEHDEPAPSVPINIIRFMKVIGGKVELDFDNDSGDSGSKSLISTG